MGHNNDGALDYFLQSLQGLRHTIVVNRGPPTGSPPVVCQQQLLTIDINELNNEKVRPSTALMGNEWLNQEGIWAISLVITRQRNISNGFSSEYFVEQANDMPTRGVSALGIKH